MLRFMFSCFVVILVVLKFGASTSPEEVRIKALHRQFKHRHTIAEERANEIDDSTSVASLTFKQTNDNLGQWNGWMPKPPAPNLALPYKQENVAMTLLGRGADRFVPDEYGNTPLHLAADRGLDAAVSRIIEIMSDINVMNIVGMSKKQAIDLQNHAGKTPLHMAVYKKCDAVIRKLLAEGANPMIADSLGNTVLHIASQHNYPRETINAIIEAAGPSPNQLLCQNGLTQPLCASSFEQSTDDYLNRDVASVSGASGIINLRNQEGRTALMSAIHFENGDLAEILLCNGADPTIPDNDGNTAMHLAINLRGSRSLVIHIIKATRATAIDPFRFVNLKNKAGKTALLLAYCCSRYDIAHILFKNGADPSISDNDGVSPLTALMSNQQTDEILFLTIKDIDINHLYNGNTLLHMAVKANFKEMIQNLLARRADPCVADKNGNTALHLAITQDLLSSDVIRDIIKAGGRRPMGQDEIEQQYGELCGSLIRLSMKVFKNFGPLCPKIINVRNHKGETALHVAVSANAGSRIKVLLEMGASRTIKCKGQTALELAEQKFKKNASVNAEFLVRQFEN